MVAITMPTTTPVKLAVLGAGLIGKRHIEYILAEPEAELLAIVDPSTAGKDVAEQKQIRWYPSFAALLANQKPDGVIVATPNQLHLENGLEILAAGVPVLVEKPITDDVVSAMRLVKTAEAAGVPLLVGHHRRHNPMIRAAKQIIGSGRLGRIIAVHASCWFMKPDEYFAVPWRRMKGAGPVLLNLIHDVDLLRCLCGEVTSVQAIESRAARGNAVEDTAVILLHFESGALGTMTISDTIVAPWSWELTSGESSAYHQTDQSCYLIGGTHASLTIPQFEIWHNKEARSWWEPLHVERVPFETADPLRLQILNFCRVIRGEEKPLVTGREGLRTLEVIAAIGQAAEAGQSVKISVT